MTQRKPHIKPRPRILRDTNITAHTFILTAEEEAYIKAVGGGKPSRGLKRILDEHRRHNFVRR